VAMFERRCRLLGKRLAGGCQMVCVSGRVA
jgi:hypothetical protein